MSEETVKTEVDNTSMDDDCAQAMALFKRYEIKKNKRRERLKKQGLEKKEDAPKTKPKVDVNPMYACLNEKLEAKKVDDDGWLPPDEIRDLDYTCVNITYPKVDVEEKKKEVEPKKEYLNIVGWSPENTAKVLNTTISTAKPKTSEFYTPGLSRCTVDVSDELQFPQLGNSEQIAKAQQHKIDKKNIYVPPSQRYNGSEPSTYKITQNYSNNYERNGSNYNNRSNYNNSSNYNSSRSGFSNYNRPAATCDWSKLQHSANTEKPKNSGSGGGFSEDRNNICKK